MQIRKLVKSGTSSLVVAVPKEWVEQNKLEPGAQVYIDEQGDKLMITTDIEDKHNNHKKEVVLHTEGRDADKISADITTAYMDNCKAIIIKGENLVGCLPELKHTVSELIALEIVEETSDRLVVSDFMDIYDTDVKQVISRMDNIVRSMMTDVQSDDPEVIKELLDRDFEVNKLSYMVFKILKAAYKDKTVMRSISIGDLDILRYWELNIHLEKLGDRVKGIAAIIGKLTSERRREFLQIFTKIEDMYRKAMKAFYKFDKDLADEIVGIRRKLSAEVQEYLASSKCHNCGQLAIHSINMLHNINDIARIIRYLD